MEKAKSQWGAQLFFDEQEGKEADSKNENVNTEEPYVIGQMM